MQIQTTVRGQHYCEWRNVHRLPYTQSLARMQIDAVTLPHSVFTLLYGERVHYYRAADNSIRVYSHFKTYPVKPIIKTRTIERRDPVRKGDIVAIVDGDDNTLYGKVLYVSRSDHEARVWMFLARDSDLIDLSLFETARGMGKVKWRIHR